MAGLLIGVFGDVSYTAESDWLKSSPSAWERGLEKRSGVTNRGGGGLCKLNQQLYVQGSETTINLTVVSIGGTTDI